MDYRLGKVIFEQIGRNANGEKLFYCEEIDSTSTEEDLLKFGAVPVEECDCKNHHHQDCTCYEWECDGIPLQDKNCKALVHKPKPKEEKIELSNIDFKSVKDWQVHFIKLESKLNEVIKRQNEISKGNY